VQGARVREEQDWNGESPDRKEHGERGTVRGRGEGDEHKKPNAFQACENGTMKDQQMKRKYAQPGEDIGQQGAGEDRQGSDEREAGDNQCPVPGRRAESSHAQHQGNDPNGAPGLHSEFGPEVKAFADAEKQPEYRRATRHEVAFVPAGEIATGVVLQQRIAIPQRRSEQHHEAA